MATELTKKEMGLIKHLSRRNYIIAELNDELNTAYDTALKMIFQLGGDLFAYAEQTGMTGIAYELSTIKTYTNKNGKDHLAHFNRNNTYFGSVKKLGKDPVKVRFNAPITSEHFTFDPRTNQFIASD